MFARLNHVAIVSDNYALLSVFYRALFGLEIKVNAKFEASAMSVGDGYVGMNVNPRMAGRQAGFDHFGIQVEDVERVRARVAKKYPKIEIIQRPSNRPFAALGIHDPAGNYFDLSQAGLKNRAEVYEAGTWEQKRRFSHFALRAIEPDRLAEFYSDVFELPLKNTPSIDGGHALSDGKMTMYIVPWRISDFLGGGIERPALDHLGFEVESLDAFRQDLDQLVVTNPLMRPKPTGVGPEGQARLKAFEKLGLGQLHMADPDGVMIAVNERSVH
jgi:predicted enzyme related to lactoylglutathione lyase